MVLPVTSTFASNSNSRRHFAHNMAVKVIRTTNERTKRNDHGHMCRLSLESHDWSHICFLLNLNQSKSYSVSYVMLRRCSAFTNLAFIKTIYRFGDKP
ncbi:hypothetical protein BLOT_003362 [Blomia tropicalis]|nr:hypothetical protein BLOT_003362 [Blomia tropicalis]